MSAFENSVKSPVDPIFGLTDTFAKDLNPLKVDLMVGVYRDENLESLRLKSVALAEKLLAEEINTKNYLPFEGDHHFLSLSAKLLFGENPSKKIAALQGIGGTGSLSMGGYFLAEMGCKTIYVSDPTWPNHFKIFSACRLEVKTYPYFDVAKTKSQIPEMIDFFKTLEKGSVVLLHTCCHNPSGVDPSREQWIEIACVFKKAGLIAFFDTAYQGFGEGLEQDVYPLSLFLKEGLEFLCSQSFSKNFGLYGERVSVLYVSAESAEIEERVESQIRGMIRASYSNPPRHGAEIVTKILSTSSLRKMWEEELKVSLMRLREMRELFAHKLTKEIPSHDWNHILTTKGMFAFIGLSKECVERLREKEGIYMTGNGRINISGLCYKNIDYVIASIKNQI